MNNYENTLAINKPLGNYYYAVTYCVVDWQPNNVFEV